MQTNIDPTSGFIQSLKNSFVVPRGYIVYLIRNKKITPLELGYMIILLCVTDWDPNIYRYGYIRHPISRLVEIFRVNKSTLIENIKKLMKAAILVKNKKLFKFIDPDGFIKKYGQNSLKKYEDPLFVYKDLFEKYGIPDDYLSTRTKSFRDSSKRKNNVADDIVTDTQGYRNGNLENVDPDDIPFWNAFERDIKKDL